MKHDIDTHWRWLWVYKTIYVCFELYTVILVYLYIMAVIAASRLKVAERGLDPSQARWTHGRPDVNKTGVSMRDCTLPGAGWSCLGWKPILESKSWQHYGACSGLFAIWAVLEGLCWEDCLLNISLSRGRSRVPSEVLFNWERKMRRLWWKQRAAKFSAMDVEKGLTWFEAKTCPYLYDSMIH